MKIVNLVDAHWAYGGVQQVSYFIDNQAQKEGFQSQTIALNQMNASERKNKILKWIEIFRSLRKELSDQNYDVIISHNRTCTALLPLSARKKTVYVLHGPVFPPNASAKDIVWLSALQFLSELKSNTIVCVSEGLKRELFIKRRKGVHVIHNAPSGNFFQTNKICERLDFLKDFDGIKIVQFGRLAYQKNQEFAIDVISHMLTKGISVKLVFIGSGLDEDYKNLVSYAKKKKLAVSGFPDSPSTEHDVIFLPAVHGLSWLTAYFDAAIFPSRYEGFPIAITEALAIGLPVVSTDCNYGPSELYEMAQAESKHPDDAKKYLKLVDMTLCHEDAVAAWTSKIIEASKFKRYLPFPGFQREQLIAKTANGWLRLLKTFSRVAVSG